MRQTSKMRFTLPLSQYLEKKMIELSMDGPNINWKVFDLLKSHRREAEWSPLMNLQSCSLHIVHGAFQTGNKATDWQIDIVLKAM